MQKKLKALLLENIDVGAHELFRHNNIEVTALTHALNSEDLKIHLTDIDILGIRSKTRLTENVLQYAKKLRAVGCFCIGTDQVDLKSAQSAGIAVFNAPFSNTRSVAELVISEIIALCRQLVSRSQEVHQGIWKKSSIGCYEVRGKTLGIVGYGHIGSQVSILAESLGMRVIYYDITTKLPLGNAQQYSDIVQVLEQADLVTLHVPDTVQTRNLFDLKMLRMMKPSSFLLNISRGSVVDLDALATVIRDKHLNGAAIDVYPHEPESNSTDFKTPLQNLPNVILTPHIGGSTVEAQQNIGREVASSLIRYVQSGSTQGSVNFPQVDLPSRQTAFRIIHVHKNIPGVLRDINRIISDANANIQAQVLSTDGDIGYLLMDLDKNLSSDTIAAIGKLATTITIRSIPET